MAVTAATTNIENDIMPQDVVCSFCKKRLNQQAHGLAYN